MSRQEENQQLQSTKVDEVSFKKKTHKPSLTAPKCEEKNSSNIDHLCVWTAQEHKLYHSEIY